MYLVSKKLKKKYDITDERASLYEAAETWVDALNGREFLGNSSFLKPNEFNMYIFSNVVSRLLTFELLSSSQVVQNLT